MDVKRVYLLDHGMPSQVQYGKDCCYSANAYRVRLNQGHIQVTKDGCDGCEFVDFKDLFNGRKIGGCHTNGCRYIINIVGQEIHMLDGSKITVDMPRRYYCIEQDQRVWNPIEGK